MAGSEERRPWLLDVDNHALLATPQCIVRDEYTERESSARLRQRVLDGGQQ